MSIAKKSKNIYLTSFFITFFISLITYSFYAITYFQGNHDFRFLRYGLSITQGLWEGRITQFLLTTLLLNNQVLPILNMIIGIFSLSLSPIILTKILNIPKQKISLVFFSLLITLSPYVLSHLYYTHQSTQTLSWHLIIVLGFAISTHQKSILNHKFINLASSFVLYLIAISGYSASMQLIFVLIFSSMILDVIYNNKSIKDIIKKYTPLIIVGLLSVITYFLITKFLISKNIMQTFMYNNQTHNFLGIINSLQHHNIKTPVQVLLSPYPYITNNISYLILGLLILTIITFYQKKRLIIGLILLIPLLISSTLTGFVSKHYLFNLYRVNMYSIPCTIAILYAINIKNTNIIIKNLSNLIVGIILAMFICSNFTAQKIWYLGTTQDHQTIERVRKHLLPKININTPYRLFFVGNLNSSPKFDITNKKPYLKTPPHHEHNGADFFVEAYFPNLLFLTEAKNPILTTSIYVSNILSLVENYETPDNSDKKDMVLHSIVPYKNKQVYNMLTTTKKPSSLVIDENIFVFLNKNYSHYQSLMSYLGFNK